MQVFMKFILLKFSLEPINANIVVENKNWVSEKSKGLQINYCLKLNW